VSANPLNRLERLLKQAVRSPSDRPAFLHELVRGRLYAVCNLDDRQNVRLVPAMLAGQLALPVYTSPERVQQATGGRQPFVELSTLEIMRNRPPGSKVVINPGVWDGLELRPDEIEDLLAEVDQSPTVLVPMGAEVRLGHPAQIPESLIALLSESMTNLDGVRAAHLAMIEVPVTGEPPHPIIGLRVAEGADFAGVVGPLKAAIGKASMGRVDFVPIGDDEISTWLLENTKPFFDR